jgi:hypothetical protein
MIHTEKETSKISDSAALYKRIVERILGSSPVILREYDGRPLDALIIYDTGHSKTELNKTDEDPVVIETTKEIFDIYFHPTLGRTDKEHFFCSTDELVYACGIQQTIKYNPMFARSFKGPFISSIETKLIDDTSWNCSKLKSELGMDKELPSSRIFLHTNRNVFLLYAQNEYSQNNDSLGEKE